MNNERLAFLLERYKSNRITDLELDEFLNYLAGQDEQSLLAAKVMADLQAEPLKGTDLPPHIAQDIMRNILQSEKKVVELLPGKKSYQKRWVWVAAAAIILLIGMVPVLTRLINKNSDGESISSVLNQNYLAKKNTGQQPLTLSLPDGSIVTLQPGAIIRYDQSFGKSGRKTHLTGNASFDVTKNPLLPFYVYNRQVVTKVLGTSFDIISDPNQNNVSVIVKTGKVQVMENASITMDSSKLAVVIVTPNQKAVYSENSRRFETSLVELPLALKEHVAPGNFKEIAAGSLQFEQSSIDQVLVKLAETFGIEVLVENENLNNCLFTGDLNNQDFFTSLKIICLTINASYEVIGTRVLVKGNGCINQTNN
ncbi:FecR family protein [Flavihumibacter sp. RY-1]|uniref:FecR family protein n=1 Tax=Flavihumibacter fluminis TaxID=2909236 RepID=A0ABS9BEK0_9BACT|nr:FecR family protein [Flavihumibacter fluminis]MCF1713715.1 FecR family protein [Flavihumibacter fluminis]